VLFRSGKELVNKDHPLVIEIWNLVFIQYNRKASGKLEALDKKHIDTGMGFERLCMVMQEKKSNYDTDVFQPIIQKIAEISGKKYGKNPKTDTAMRVVADHLRAISFSIADGQLPANNKAGYVIRRILRRAVRYSYTFLQQQEPFIYRLVPSLIENMGDTFKELPAQQELIEKVIMEEEQSFLKTLSTGIKMLEDIAAKIKNEAKTEVSGRDAFVLYDTFGFPLDLTELILKEKNLQVDTAGFNKEMADQKNRSKSDAEVVTEDWTILQKDDRQEFIGYDYTSADINIVKYRKTNMKGKDLYQLVFNVTPFYAESGGQVGDKGYIEAGEEKIPVIDTINENNLNIHITKLLPKNLDARFKAYVDRKKRLNTAGNHTATHLLHQALRVVLGSHVEQKGSLVHPDYLRFDFSHFQKVSDEEIEKIENLVNQTIRKNYVLEEKRAIPMPEANKMGAIGLFSEKYGDLVRVVKYGDSIELCGGTHVQSTGQIGYFKILSEGSVAAGIRRIEAISGDKSAQYLQKHLKTLEQISGLMNHPKNLVESVENLLKEKNELEKKLETFSKEKTKQVKASLKENAETINGINIIAASVDIDSAAAIKDLAFQLKGEMDNLFLTLGADLNGKANLTIMISDNLVKEKNLHAGNIIRKAAKEINGGGGGQPFYATAGGKNVQGLQKALETAKGFVV
jgi:alanyl-tRNA synthetase